MSNPSHSFTSRFDCSYMGRRLSSRHSTAFTILRILKLQTAVLGASFSSLGLVLRPESSSDLV